VNSKFPIAAVLVLATACATPMPPPAPIMPASIVPIDGSRDESHPFARVFCSTLAHFRQKDGHAWGDCAKYLEASETPQAQPKGAFAAPYRFLFVAGFGGDCFNGVRAFGPSIAHLGDAHSVKVEAFSVSPFGSSDENGRSIARHIDDGWAADATRKYVLIGYDKGAVDLLEALRALNAPATKVAALVTIAGDIGGLWIPDDVRALVQPSQPWIGQGCPGNVGDGLHSLLRDVRERSLRENPIPVPGYSLVAASTPEETSRVLAPSWSRLSRYSVEQDGQVVAWEAVLPGAKFLGTARADHWAVALPFEEASVSAKAINRNHFPRDALFEAIVRFVATDLAAAASHNDSVSQR